MDKGAAPGATLVSLPSESKDYLAEKRIPELLESMYRSVVLARPENPIAFMRDYLKNPPAPRISFVFPPYCSLQQPILELLQAQLSVPFICAPVEPPAVCSPLSNEQTTLREVIPPLKQLTKPRGGWALVNFPQTRLHALHLQDIPATPTTLVQLVYKGSAAANRQPTSGAAAEGGAADKVATYPPDVLAATAAAGGLTGPEEAQLVLQRYAQHIKEVGKVLRLMKIVEVELDGADPSSAVSALVTVAQQAADENV